MAGTERGGVFINCPFDDGYRPIFDAISFTVLACDFAVRSALEINDSGELRLQKLYRLIGEATHSIHDISRVEIDIGSGLPRFNMPIELGIALGRGRFGSRRPRPRMLILDSERYRYQKFASDLAGLDIAEHGGDPRQAIACVRHFLSVDAHPIPSPDWLASLYEAFEVALPGIAADQRQSVEELGFLDRLRLARAFLASMDGK